MLLQKHSPALIILDLGLPDTYGIDILKKIREWYQKPVIILSVRNSEDDIINALDKGANDYLTKPFRSGELLARIRVALRYSQDKLEEPNLTFDTLTIDLPNHIARKKGEILKLTATEFSLLALLAKKFRTSADSSDHFERDMGIRICRTDTIFKSFRGTTKEKN